MALFRIFACLLFGPMSIACAHQIETNINENGQDNSYKLNGEPKAFDANLLVTSYYELCLETELDVTEIKRVASERGWAPVLGSESLGTGRSRWVHKNRLRLEVLDGAEFTKDLVICSVSGFSIEIENAEQEITAIRAILKDDWNLGSIEYVETGIVSDLPPELRDVLEVDGAEAPKANQYKFAMEQKNAPTAHADRKYGYLWFGGEHRLNVSRPKY